MSIRYTLALSGLLAFLPGLAQLTFNPDAFGDMHNTATGWVEHVGQKLGTDLSEAKGLMAYADGYGMDIWLMDESRFKLSKTVHGTQPTDNDTTFCVMVKAAGSAAERTPQHYLPLPGHTNFYYPHTGTTAENVKSHHREVYKDVWTRTSMHFYTSRGGPKLSFVCEPGGNPGDMLLQFEGQDSLKVDINGFLKMYMRGRELVLAQAVAYQINNFGIPVLLPWFPTWQIVNGIGQVTFNFGTYDHTKALILQIGAPPQGAWDPDEPRNMRWSTYAGSNNSDEFMATDVDASGDVYVTGYTYQANFPVGTGYQVHEPFNENFGGSEDVVTMKFAAMDKRIQWATFQGGTNSATSSSNEPLALDKAYDMVAYRGSNTSLEYIFITGSTRCTDFPVRHEPNSPFTNADVTAFTGGLTNEQRAAFISAYTQHDGKLHWSTTMGTDSGDIWETDGLGLDILDDGTLVWCGRLTTAFSNFTYPSVTPTGAFSRANGGGFFILFNSAYQIAWNTPFGAICEISGVFDVKVDRVGPLNQQKAFITGITCEGSPGLDVYQPPGHTGFFQASSGGERDAYLAVLNLETYQLEYCTHWGGDKDDYGIALETVTIAPHGSKQVWVGGLSKSTDLSSTQLPAPNMGGLHQSTNAGNSDAIVLMFSTTPEMDLIYGSLYGGEGHDAIFDLEAGKDGNSVFGASQIYATGETGSASDIILLDAPALFQQDLLGNTPSNGNRDAFLLAMDVYSRTALWTTYIGGTHTDKGWGVAVSQDELYLVGGTVSDQATFPLKEFNTNAPQDWYDGDLMNNIGNWFNGHYSFNSQHFYYPFALQVSPLETAPQMAHDAFITSFGVSPALWVPQQPTANDPLMPMLISSDGLWSVVLPDQVQVLRIFDAGGRLVEERSTVNHSGQVLIDLRQRPSGVYAITCITKQGAALGTKLFKP